MSTNEINALATILLAFGLIISSVSNFIQSATISELQRQVQELQQKALL